MSTPLFIQTPTFGSSIESGNPFVGEDITDPTTCTLTDLTAITTEPTLIEEVLWATADYSTSAAEFLLFVKNNGGQRSLIGAYTIPAGSATRRSSGRISVNVTLPVGYKLCAAHSVKSGASYSNVYAVPTGGVVS